MSTEFVMLRFLSALILFVVDNIRRKLFRRTSRISCAVKFDTGDCTEGCCFEKDSVSSDEELLDVGMRTSKNDCSVSIHNAVALIVNTGNDDEFVFALDLSVRFLERRDFFTYDEY